MINTTVMRGAAALAFTACFAACQTAGTMTAASPNQTQSAAISTADDAARYEADRQAILAMAGNYDVDFDFKETVSFVEGYELKERYVSGGHEVVLVVEDRPGFISLQHILVVGGKDKMPVKHWRQDWVYEPEDVLTFIGGNAWEMKPVSAADRKGKWAQMVYQVDDSPRYGAVAAWSHANGVSEWVPPAALRPLPRRDMTKRDDYHGVLAVNRHAITPEGWVHEQDNSKVVLGDEPYVLVREVGVNTYRRFDDFEVDVATSYWNKTAEYWAKVRDSWAELEDRSQRFALTLKGEPEDLYNSLLGLSSVVEAGDMSAAEAAMEAKDVIAEYTTDSLPPIAQRLRTAPKAGDAAR